MHLCTRECHFGLYVNKGKAASNDPYDGSVAEGMMVNEDVDKTSSSSYKDNINGNKAEAPKLSVERQQMKRKKRCGGYNLRKSLAWDRAFFTEEGFLFLLVTLMF